MSANAWIKREVLALARLAVLLERSPSSGDPDLVRRYEVEEIDSSDFDLEGHDPVLHCYHQPRLLETLAVFVDEEWQESACVRCVLELAEVGRADILVEDVLRIAERADDCLDVPVLERELDLLRRETDPAATSKEKFAVLRERFGR